MVNYFGPKDFKGHWSPDKKIIYDKKPVESWQCMPVGTGKTGCTVWVPDGLCLQISHNGCWAPDGNLPSIMRIHIDVDGKPFTNSKMYRQELDLCEAAVKIQTADLDGDVSVYIIAHTELDVIYLEICDNRNSKGKITIRPEVWRQGMEIESVDDFILCTETNRISGFDEINLQSGVKKGFIDPIKGLSYGAAIWTDRWLDRHSDDFIREEGADAKIRVMIAAASGKMSKEDLVHELKNRIKNAVAIPEYDIKCSHRNSWKCFWDKSRLELNSASNLQQLRAVWHLNRYFTASAMAGQFVPKFNGSIFLYEYDRRCWGGPYWFQNTRLMYWPLFKCGDMEYIRQLFDMYFNALEYSKARVTSIYGHEGAIFPETMYFWGGVRIGDAAEGKGIINQYIKSYFSGSLELLMLMLEYDRYGMDRSFAYDRLFPMAEEILAFFFNHFPIRSGRLFLEKSSALETWWEADNPADQVAGLMAVMTGIIRVAERIGYQSHSLHKWKSYLSLIPSLPRGKKGLAPAQKIHHKQKENCEDPELYAIWPYGIFGIQLPDYDEALKSYQNRLHKDPCNGWSQTAVWAARLGLGEEAARILHKQFDCCALLPGGMMYSPGDKLPQRPDVPDCGYFDSCGVMTTALNEMLLQDYTGTIHLLPAWPKDETVYFKLHSIDGKIIEGSN